MNVTTALKRERGHMCVSPHRPRRNPKPQVRCCPQHGPNKAVEPTPYSLRYAAAFGRGSPLALGLRRLRYLFIGGGEGNMKTFIPMLALVLASLFSAAMSTCG